jgi:hypothetical protein
MWSWTTSSSARRRRPEPPFGSGFRRTHPSRETIDDPNQEDSDMALQRLAYADARDKMQAGDVIAFGGKGDFSDIIKWATRSSVSHVGVILQSKLLINGNPQDGIFNQIIESTSLNGFSGVSISRLSQRLYEYDGEVWWLPLGSAARAALNGKKLYDFLIHQDHKPYDMPQAVLSALDALDSKLIPGRPTHNKEDFARFFCSELVAAGLEAGGVIRDIDASEVTPADLCMFKIFQMDYYQMKGQDKSISGFNTLDPTGWGV